MGPDFFLDRMMNTRLPPTLGIINYIQSTILIFFHYAILNSLGMTQTTIFIRPCPFPFGDGSFVSQLVERFSIGYCFSFVQKFRIRPVTSSWIIKTLFLGSKGRIHFGVVTLKFNEVLDGHDGSFPLKTFFIQCVFGFCSCDVLFVVVLSGRGFDVLTGSLSILFLFFWGVEDDGSILVFGGGSDGSGVALGVAIDDAIFFVFDCFAVFIWCQQLHKVE